MLLLRLTGSVSWSSSQFQQVSIRMISPFIWRQFYFPLFLCLLHFPLFYVQLYFSVTNIHSSNISITTSWIPSKDFHLFHGIQYLKARCRISRPIRSTFLPEKCDLNSTCVLCAEGKYYFQTCTSFI